MALVEDRAELEKVRQKIADLLETGQMVSVTGAFTVQNPILSALREQEAHLRKRILRQTGYCGRVS
jgi:hypothetical protein